MSEAASTRNEPDWRRLRILIVDSDVKFQSWAQSVLLHRGVNNSYTATNSDEAMVVLRREPIDLCLVDLFIDNSTASAFLRLLRNPARSPNPDMAIILLSRSGDQKLLREACQAGIENLVRKPVSQTDLLRRITATVRTPRRIVWVDTYIGPDRRNPGTSAYEGPERRRSRRTLAPPPEAPRAVEKRAAPTPLQWVNAGRPPVADEDGEGTTRRTRRPPAAPQAASQTASQAADAPAPAEPADPADAQAWASALGELRGLRKQIESEWDEDPARRGDDRETGARHSDEDWRREFDGSPAKPRRDAGDESIEVAGQPERRRARNVDDDGPESNAAAAEADEDWLGEDEAVEDPDEEDELDVEGILDDHLAWLKSRGADGERADLAGEDLRGVDFAGRMLVNADLRDAELSGADLTGANLEGADLRGAVLSASRCQATNLNIAKLRRVDFTKSNLRGAMLRGADLSGAIFGGAVFEDTDLTGANLFQTDLRGADLRRAGGLVQSQLMSVVGDRFTRLPPGLRLPPQQR